MEKINAWPPIFGMSLTTGVAYSICALFIVLAPLNAVKFFNAMLHGIDLTKIMGKIITWSSFFAGLIEVIVITAVLTLLFVIFYNLCLEHCIRRGWIGGKRDFLRKKTSEKNGGKNGK